MAIEQRIAALDWPRLTASLQADGVARAGPLLSVEECRSLAGLYADPGRFRSRVVMARHGFGSGEYQYFAYPLPDLVARLREALYPPLALVANAWAERLGAPTRYPESLPEMLDRCREAGQTRPTPLLLSYQAGDYNCLHQDLYGEHAFPLQAVFLLSDPDQDFEGGEFVLVEQRPRMQSRPRVFQLKQGEALIFAVNHRPVQGAKGVYRTALRHGVSTITRGRRMTAGIIFHDAT
ncbi:MAG: 2OG-Fe(II) oxygenase [Elsteraceae bacterium]